MKYKLRFCRSVRWLPVFLAMGALLHVSSASAGRLPDAVEAEDPAFQPVGERRAAGILKDLDLADSDRAARVRRYVQNFIIATKNVNEGGRVLDYTEHFSGVAKTEAGDVTVKPAVEAKQTALFKSIQNKSTESCPKCSSMAYVHDGKCRSCRDCGFKDGGCGE